MLLSVNLMKIQKWRLCLSRLQQRRLVLTKQHVRYWREKPLHLGPG